MVQGHLLQLWIVSLLGQRLVLLSFVKHAGAEEPEHAKSKAIASVTGEDDFCDRKGKYLFLASKEKGEKGRKGKASDRLYEGTDLFGRPSSSAPNKYHHRSLSLSQEVDFGPRKLSWKSDLLCQSQRATNSFMLAESWLGGFGFLLPGACLGFSHMTGRGKQTMQWNVKKTQKGGAAQH